jgi:cell wall-associated NlpC family hydrolase
VAALAAAGLSLVATAPPAVASAPTAPTTTRIAGETGFATAVAVSAATFAPGVTTAYLATGADFADALAGGPAAAKADGPLLLTATDTLPNATAAELRRLAPKKIVVLGGPAAVAPDVVAALTAIAPVTRLAGADRYETATAVSAATFLSGISAAYVATGQNFADALAGGPAAAKTGSPMLLTTTASVPATTIAELQRLKPKKIIVLGGTAAVTADVVTALKAIAPVTRLAGDTRYSTATAVSAATFPAGISSTYVATGETFTDALVGGPAAAHAGAPMILTPPSGPPMAVKTEIGRLLPATLVVIGTTASVPDAAVAKVVAATGAGLPDPSPKASIAVDTATAQLGKPYLYGGAGPDSFDCSGLVMFSWKAAGVTIPRTTDTQQTALPYVPVSLLAPGDVVFFGSPAFHVGIYIGNGQMIEAPHTGAVVRVVSINRIDLAGGGRPT